MEYESQTPSFLSIIPHIYPVIEEYTIKGKTITVLKTVEDLHTWYSQLLAMTIIEESEQIKTTVDSLLVGAGSELEKG